jgi:hypothetical protein
MAETILILSSIAALTKLDLPELGRPRSVTYQTRRERGVVIKKREIEKEYMQDYQKKLFIQ